MGASRVSFVVFKHLFEMDAAENGQCWENTVGGVQWLMCNTQSTLALCIPK